MMVTPRFLDHAEPSQSTKERIGVDPDLRLGYDHLKAASHCCGCWSRDGDA
jgi:hypothetical protein